MKRGFKLLTLALGVMLAFAFRSDAQTTEQEESYELYQYSYVTVWNVTRDEEGTIIKKRLKSREEIPVTISLKSVGDELSGFAVETDEDLTLYQIKFNYGPFVEVIPPDSVRTFAARGINKKTLSSVFFIETWDTVTRFSEVKLSRRNF